MGICCKYKHYLNAKIAYIIAYIVAYINSHKHAPKIKTAKTFASLLNASISKNPYPVQLQ